VWLVYRRWPILRAIYVAGLALSIWAWSASHFFLLISLGQFAKAWLLIRRP